MIDIIHINRMFIVIMIVIIIITITTIIIIITITISIIVMQPRPLRHRPAHLVRRSLGPWLTPAGFIIVIITTITITIIIMFISIIIIIIAIDIKITCSIIISISLTSIIDSVISILAIAISAILIIQNEVGTDGVSAKVPRIPGLSERHFCYTSVVHVLFDLCVTYLLAYLAPDLRPP